MASSPDLPAIPNIDENSYRLTISDTVSHDNSVVELSQHIIDKLNLPNNSTIIIKSDKERTTVCTLKADALCPSNKIRINLEGVGMGGGECWCLFS
ncbi:unnamed protein product [Adineta steineri]|uniref:Uncharacterized protein n=1 Tax=Adineta steineri TaxID=433720 RepID=A0A815UH64_9BILA|nr:unnamed protein product [Adineta steineri]CAF4205894.1 unnamed protein product [Adineta steineri]